MHVQVKNHLPAGRLAELLEDDTFRVEGLHRGDRDPFGGERNRGEVAFRDVEDPRAGALGITSVCPGERGMMSRKARLRSSLKTSKQGISPRRIFTKTF